MELNMTVQTTGHTPQFLYEFTYRAANNPLPQWAGKIYKPDSVIG
jgi:hypothetical protein